MNIHIITLSHFLSSAEHHILNKYLKLITMAIHKAILTVILFAFITSENILTANSPYPYKYPYPDGINSDTYKTRRDNLRKAYSDNNLIVLLSPGLMNQNIRRAKFRQDPNFFYLSGMPDPKSAMIIAPGGVMVDSVAHSEILFISPQSDSDILWNGVRMGIDEAKNILGIDKVMDFKKFESILSIIINNIDTLRYSGSGHARHFKPYSTEGNDYPKILQDALEPLESLVITNSIGKLKEMREVKDKDELRLIQKAVDITIAGHREAIGAAKPGITEYQLQALMESEFRYNGPENPAFNSIIAAGLNSCILHYTANRDTARDGDLVLMDCGASYGGYNADITRTFPVNGRYSPEQLIIYNLVLDAHRAAIAECQAGNDFKAAHNKATEILGDGLIGLGIIDSAEDISDYFPHSTSHYLGLDVHDAGTNGELKPGTVMTVEPGIYIPQGSPCDEKWWNIGIRIEDDILITDGGPIILSKALPVRPDEIEAMMK